MDLEVAVFDLLASNAPLYLKGCADSTTLSEQELFQFDKFVSAQMSLYYSAYVQYQEGLIGEAMWQAYAATIRDYLKKPGFVVIWRSTEALYPKEFIDLIYKI